MIEIIITYGVIAVVCIPATIIGEVMSKHIRRRVREAERQQAQQDQAEISALYNNLIINQIWEG